MPARTETHRAACCSATMSSASAAGESSRKCRINVSDKFAEAASMTAPPSWTHAKHRNRYDTIRTGNRRRFSSSTLLLALLVLAVHATHGDERAVPSDASHLHPVRLDGAANLAATSAHLPATPNSSASAIAIAQRDADDGFRPIIPTDIDPGDISRNVFTTNGQYRIFEPAESDLRATTTMRRPANASRQPGGSTSQSPATGQPGRMVNPRPKAAALEPSNSKPLRNHSSTNASASAAPSVVYEDGADNEIGTHGQAEVELEQLLAEYVQNFFEKGQYEPMPGLIIALQKNRTQHVAGELAGNGTVLKRRHPRDAAAGDDDDGGAHISLNIPRALQSGRFLFFAGLKKVLWPVFMGLQILKSLLFALLLPTLIGSVGKLLGKGIISGSAPLFIRPMDAPQDVDFKDNSFNFDEDNNKFTMTEDAVKDADAYAYNQPAASQVHNQYAYNAAAINQQALSRYGMTGQQQMQDSYLSALQSLSSASFKNSNAVLGGLSAGGSSGGGGGVGAGTALRNKPAAPAVMNTFQQFQKVPASSLLLSNYDPFYSPLLSRLDSVFAQLKLNSENEACREKLICLMYANPAKYAPYSNLVSAQLSRELNELRKPTSDNPDILRFFKYMRAAKDGQDGIECEKTFDGCDEFKDFENPAMVSTYHDINKLVQARKFT